MDNMVDVVSPAVRSRMMAGIRGKDTGPEMLVRRFLHSRGLRYRLHDRSLPGTPDLVFSRHRVAIFVHGCYWHRHRGCRYATVPSSNIDFWQRKFELNLKRDHDAIKQLKKDKWRVILLWECGLRHTSEQGELEWLPGEIRMGKSPLLEWPKIRPAGKR